MKNQNIAHKMEDVYETAKDNFNSHTTARQRAAIAVTGALVVAASVVGLKSWAEDAHQDRLTEVMYSDPAIGQRIEDGELEADRFVPVTAVEGDSPASIAARFVSDSIDVRTLQGELAGQAGEDGLHPGEVLYLPVDQLDLQTLVHD